MSLRLPLHSKSGLHGSKLWPLPGADLVILLERGGSPLVQQLAEDLAHEQTNRSASSTVGARFREQLRDLIARLDKCATFPALGCRTCRCTPCCLHHALVQTHSDRPAPGHTLRCQVEEGTLAVPQDSNSDYCHLDNDA